MYVSLKSNGGTLTHLFSLRASDLVMKVDALLSAAPKGEVRRDVHFVKDSHRYNITLSLCGLCVCVCVFRSVKTSASHVFCGM